MPRVCLHKEKWECAHGGGMFSPDFFCGLLDGKQFTDIKMDSFSCCLAYGIMQLEPAFRETADFYPKQSTSGFSPIFILIWKLELNHWYAWKIISSSLLFQDILFSLKAASSRGHGILPLIPPLSELFHTAWCSRSSLAKAQYAFPLFLCDYNCVLSVRFFVLTEFLSWISPLLLVDLKINVAYMWVIHPSSLLQRIIWKKKTNTLGI